MKAELKIFVIFILLFVNIINPISSVPKPNGYDIIHTRVMEGSFEIISFKDKKIPYKNQGVKLNYTIELWNPSTENVTFIYDDSGSCGFVLTFNDSKLPDEISCGIYVIHPNITVLPGVTTINVAYETVSRFRNPDETIFGGLNGTYNVELKLYQFQNSSHPFGISYSSSIEFLNNISLGFESNLPNNWGTINESLPVKISTAVTHAEFRFIQLNNSQVVRLGFIGESWNPQNSTVYTTSSHDCYDRLQFKKIISISNDFFLDDTSTFCTAMVVQYETKPGVHQWEESIMSVTLYNWDSQTLPDGKYYFYFTLFQNPLNIHKSKLTVNNGQIEIKYLTAPLWIQQMVNTSDTVNPSLTNSLTESTTAIYPGTTQESTRETKSFSAGLISFTPLWLVSIIFIRKKNR